MNLRSLLPLAFMLLALTATWGMTSCQSKKPVAPKRPALPDTSPIGTAQLAPDGTLRVMLRVEPDAEGKRAVIDQTLHSYKVGTPEYDRYMKHIGGLVPGQSKLIPPFPSSDR